MAEYLNVFFVLSLPFINGPIVDNILILHFWLLVFIKYDLINLVNKLFLHGMWDSYLFNLRIHSFNASNDEFISFASLNSLSLCFILLLIESLPYSEPAKSANTIWQLFILFAISCSFCLRSSIIWLSLWTSFPSYSNSWSISGFLTHWGFIM